MLSRMRTGACLCGLAVAGTCLAVDTTVGVRGLPGGSSLLKDVNTDGVITDADIVLQLLDALGPGPDADRDGDGELTAADTVLAVEKLLLASCGDVNASEVVDADDLSDENTALMEGTTDPAFDANADGVVDGEDMLFVMDEVGNSAFVFVSSETTTWLAAYMVQARNEGSEALWTNQGDTKEHHVEISDDWTSPPGHSLESSHKVWPPNHMGPHSRTWPERTSQPPHGVELSNLWPPNHRDSISRGWETTHESRISYRDEVHWRTRSYSHMVPESHLEYRHEAYTSARWDTLHDAWSSSRWRSTPNHRRMASYLWDPTGPGQPDDHSQYVSRRWPLNHDPQYSIRDNRVIPRVHEAAVTQEWTDQGHFASTSAGWPPMHYWYVSTQRISHEVRYSIVWPPNHHGAPSSTWPQRLLPGSWPPNHMEAQSNTPGSPAPPLGPADWPMWPQDHNWFHTIREIITLPGEMPNPFPSASGQ